MDPKHEKHWRDFFTKRPYAEEGSRFEDYGPAYQYGLEVVKRHEGKTFAEAEHDVQRDWDGARGASTLDWEKAKHPVRDAWEWVKTDIDHD